MKQVLTFLYDTGNLCFIIGGNNIGRVGIVQHRERHLGSFDIAHVKVKFISILKDANGKAFATR